MSNLYKYPEPDEIQINESALRLKLQKFAEAVRSNGSFADLFIIVPAWTPVFFSVFTGYRGIPGSALKAGYTVLIALATLDWITHNRLVARFFRRWVLWDRKWTAPEIDPDKIVESIKEECVAGGSKLSQLPDVIGRTATPPISQKNGGAKNKN